MRILFISQYFPPEVNAPAARTSEHARVWAQDGHLVTVLTAFPHHPTGIVARPYRRRALVRERWEGVSVVRTFVYATPNRGTFKRILSYLSFMVSACVLGPFCVRRPDVVVATSPQFFVAIAGWLLSRAKRAPFVFEVRDFWPASIKAVGAMRDSRLLRFLERLELSLYQAAAKIVVVTDSMKRELIARGIEADKVAVLKNGVDLSAFQPARATRPVRQQLSLEHKFVVTYIGTHGMAHGLDTVLRCADRLRDEERVHFLFVGEGAEKPRLLGMRDELALTNVTFLDQQPRHVIPALLAASDLCLVPLRKAELFTTVIPSKMFEIVAMARPILLSVDGEARSVLEGAGAGVYVPPEDCEAMCRSIVALMENPELRKTMGRAGRAYVKSTMGRDTIARRYQELLADVAGT